MTDWTGIIGTGIIVVCVIALAVVAQIKAKPEEKSK